MHGQFPADAAARSGHQDGAPTDKFPDPLEIDPHGCCGILADDGDKCAPGFNLFAVDRRDKILRTQTAAGRRTIGNNLSDHRRQLGALKPESHALDDIRRFAGCERQRCGLVRDSQYELPA